MMAEKRVRSKALIELTGAWRVHTIRGGVRNLYTGSVAAVFLLIAGVSVAGCFLLPSIYLSAFIFICTAATVVAVSLLVRAAGRKRSKELQCEWRHSLSEMRLTAQRDVWLMETWPLGDRRRSNSARATSSVTTGFPTAAIDRWLELATDPLTAVLARSEIAEALGIDTARNFADALLLQSKLMLR